MLANLGKGFEQEARDKADAERWRLKAEKAEAKQKKAREAEQEKQAKRKKALEDEEEKRQKEVAKRKRADADKALAQQKAASAKEKKGLDLLGVLSSNVETSKDGAKDETGEAEAGIISKDMKENNGQSNSAGVKSQPLEKDGEDGDEAGESVAPVTPEPPGKGVEFRLGQDLQYISAKFNTWVPCKVTKVDNA